MGYKCDICNIEIKGESMIMIKQHNDGFNHNLLKYGKVEIFIYMYSTNTHSYIGSTFNVECRKSKHISDCFNQNSKSYNVPFYKYIRDNNLTFDNLQFEMLETVEVSNESEKKCQEQWWIDTLQSNLNTINSFGVDIEYRKQKNKEYKQKYRDENPEYLNKEEINRKRKIWYENNREEINRKVREQYKNKKQ